MKDPDAKHITTTARPFQPQIPAVKEPNMTDFEAAVLSDLSVLKNQMQQVIGNGTTGRIGQIEDRVLRHDQALQRMRGSAAAFGGFLTLLHVAIDYVAAKH